MINSIEFGIEIEMTGIAKIVALNTIATVINGTVNNTTYYAHALDELNRKWTVVYDSSINNELTSHGISSLFRELYGERVTFENYSESCHHFFDLTSEINSTSIEVTSPICTIKDIETIQKIVRALKKEGAVINESCGIHIHIGKQKLSYKGIKNLILLTYKYQDDIYNIFNVSAKRESYCKKLNRSVFNVLSSPSISLDSNDSIENVSKDLICSAYNYYWASNDYPIRSQKYYLLNISNLQILDGSKDTIEFRVFNSTLHAGKIRAYIVFILTLVAKAESLKTINGNIKPKELKTLDDLNKLISSNGFNDEFNKNVLYHLENGLNKLSYFK